MNFLQMCQRAAVECGVASGSAIKTALPTVVGATGSLGRIVGWVSDSVSDIMQDHDDWPFLRSSNILGGGVSFQTVAGQASYPLGLPGGGDFDGDFGGDLHGIGGTVGIDPELFGKWDRETVWSFTTANGYRDEINLGEVTFDAWRAAYMKNANRDVRSRPMVFAVGPDQSLCLGPNVNGLYTVTADYFMIAPVLALDTDVPLGLPTNYHMLPVYRTMMKYAGYESAPEVYQRGSEENAGMYAQLQAVRAPRFSFGGALA